MKKFVLVLAVIFAFVCGVTGCKQATEDEESTVSYGTKSQVPSDAVELTVDEMDGTKNIVRTLEISSSDTQYFYFYLNANKTYYVTWFDKYAGASALTSWGKTTHANIKIAGCFAGYENNLSSTDFISNTSTKENAVYVSFSLTYSGYYVLVVKPNISSSSGYYGIRVSTTQP